MTSKNYIINNLAILAELKEKALAEGNREYAERIQTDIDELDNVFDDLKRLDELKRENQSLKEEYEMLDRAYNSCHLDYEDLKGENEKYKKALDKACKMLDWECPVYQDLIADLDCENRCSADFEECCKECWKIYFLKELVGNE